MECENCGAEIDATKTYCPECHQLVNTRDLSDVLADDDIDEKKFFAANKEKQQNDWNWWAFFWGPIWYMRQGMIRRGIVLSLVGMLLSLVNPITYLIVMVYCGFRGDKDYQYYR